MGMMRHGVAVDAVRRPRRSAPGSTRQDRSDGRDETRSMRMMWEEGRVPAAAVTPRHRHHRHRLRTRSARGGRPRPQEAQDATDVSALLREAAGVAPGLHILFSQRDPSVNRQFPKGFFFAWLAGGGWFGVSYSPSWAQSWAQLGTAAWGVKSRAMRCLSISVRSSRARCSPDQI
jgi:hypothetical protein